MNKRGFRVYAHRDFPAYHTDVIDGIKRSMLGSLMKVSLACRGGWDLDGLEVPVVELYAHIDAACLDEARTALHAQRCRLGILPDGTNGALAGTALCSFELDRYLAPICVRIIRAGSIIDKTGVRHQADLAGWLIDHNRFAAARYASTTIGRDLVKNQFAADDREERMPDLGLFKLVKNGDPAELASWSRFRFTLVPKSDSGASTSLTFARLEVACFHGTQFACCDDDSSVRPAELHDLDRKLYNDGLLYTAGEDYQPGRDA